MEKRSNGREFLDGLKSGIPIALGYLGVSFGFGISSVNLGIPTLITILISMTNVTSAGQVAGVTIIASLGTLIEMALTQLVINIRYSLMGISLTQKLSENYGTVHRLITSFWITDEIFAVGASREGEVTPAFMYGIGILPYIGWSGGTALGALAGNILPDNVTLCLSLAIYGMFLAIIIPPMRSNSGVLAAVVLSAALSCAFAFIPVISGIPSGYSLIICAIAGACIAAVIKPVKEEE